MGTLWTRIEGGKHYLSQMEVGQTIVYNGPYKWRSLQAVACRMREDYDSMFVFRTRKGIRTIMRVK